MTQLLQDSLNQKGPEKRPDTLQILCLSSSAGCNPFQAGEFKMDLGQLFILTCKTSDSEVILPQKLGSTGNFGGCICVTTVSF